MNGKSPDVASLKSLMEEELADVEGLPREMLLVFESQKDAL